MGTLDVGFFQGAESTVPKFILCLTHSINAAGFNLTVGGRYAYRAQSLHTLING
jgi:hypothetical protein